MKEPTNKELAQRAMERYDYLTQLQNGRKGYWWDQEELNRAFFEGLRKQQSHADAYLYWLAGSGDQISSKQEEELQWQLEYNHDTVIIPLNHRGMHWDCAVLERNSKGVWQAYKVDNVGVAGLCGKRTVDQSLEILKVGVKAFAEQNPGLVRQLDNQDKIYQPVQRILNKANGIEEQVQQTPQQTIRSEVKSYSPTQWRDYDLEAGISENKRFLRNSNPFEYELGKMAHSEITLKGNRNDSLANRDFQKSQGLLTQMFAKMTSQEQEFTINRLMGSALSQKSSVSKIIHSLLTTQNNPVAAAPATPAPKLSANANSLLVTAQKAAASVANPEPTRSNLAIGSR